MIKIKIYARKKKTQKLSKINIYLRLHDNMAFPFLAFGIKTENIVNHGDCHGHMGTVTFLARHGCVVVAVVCS